MATESVDLFGNESSKSNVLTLEGSVSRIFFQSNDNLYKVLLVDVQNCDFDWNDTEITVTGDFGDIEPNTNYVFKGRIINHPKYGKQFRVDQYSTKVPTSREGLIAYLSGTNFPGIGKTTASKIVDDLGNSLINDIYNNAHILDPLKLTKKQRDSIINGIKNNKGDEQIIIALKSYGFGSSLTSKIYNKYGDKTINVLENNPYKLVEDINGISFKKADQVALKMGFKINSTGRIKSGIITALEQLSLQDGGTYTEMKSLINQAFSLLNDSNSELVSMQEIADQIVNLAKDGKIIGNKDNVFLSVLYNDEKNIAENVKRLLDVDDDSRSISDKKISQAIHQISADATIDYDDSQEQALKKAMKSSMFLLTGGPGTGKTTIIKGIITLYAKLYNLSLNFSDYNEDYPFLLAAPTGRAAKRMKETTGVEASTIHRLLGLDITDQKQNDDLALENQLSGKVLIIDEMSMVDTYLFNVLLNAVPNGMKVILVGDKDQLPSVGPGQIFSDLLASNLIPKIELNTIHRQKDDSTIVSLAHSIRNGQVPTDFGKREKDRSFLHCDSHQVVSVISQVVNKAKDKFDIMDLQVLAPMYRGEDGINNLNRVIQEIINPKTVENAKEVNSNNFTYRIGDKVLQLENDSQNNVFNGDIGIIVGIDLAKDSKKNNSEDKITVSFGDQIEVTYAKKDWNQITLAYCTSIHKAQGCEFNTIILPMVPQYHRMLKRNLLYTAITRAAKFLIMIGDYSSFKECVESQSINRKTGLIEQLKKAFGVKTTYQSDSNSNEDSHSDTENDELANSMKPKILTPGLVQSGNIDPMIGMEGISPQDYNS